jgi:glycosyltransferase involved in cell wall biosynthesis
VTRASQASGDASLCTSPIVACVIPVHNRVAWTRQCLDGLERQDQMGMLIIVVDDGSTDGTAEMLRTEYPEVEVITGDGNLWWTRATNAGVNDDTTPPDDLVSTMVADAARVQPALLVAMGVSATDGRVLYAGEIVDWPRARFVQVSPDTSSGTLAEVTHCPGRGLLVPASAFSEIGLFDAMAFPHGGADFDFSARAASAGYQLYCDHAARLTIYPETHGGAAFTTGRSLEKYLRHLFGRKGAGNLGVYVTYAWRYCPRRYLPIAIPLGVLRRVGGYLRDWATELRLVRSDS